MYLKPDDAISDLRYEVTSEVPVLSEAEKVAAPPVDPDQFARYLDLPADFPQNVTDLAEQVTQRRGHAVGAGRRDRALPEHGRRLRLQRPGRAVALDRHARGIPLRHATGTASSSRSAFAAMARSIGLPTRVAVGYSYGTPQNGVWHVKNKDAHAWPEVYFSGLGWVPLEPTPGRGANAPGGTGDPTQRPQESATASAPETTTPTTTAGATPPPSLGSPQANQDDISLGQDASTSTRPRSSVGQFFVALAFVAVALAILALIGIVVLIVLAVRRTWRRRHADDPRARVLGAWAQALDHLADAGVRAKTVGHSPRIRAAPRPRARRGCRRPRLRWSWPSSRPPRCSRPILRPPTTPTAVGAGRRDRRRTVARAVARHPVATTARPAPLRAGRAVAGAAISRSLNPRRDRGAGRRTRERSAVERPHLGLDVLRQPVDGDEQRELAGAERVEDLAVVAARPDARSVGHEPQAREVVTRRDQRLARHADPGRRQPRVEERAHEPQRDEVTEVVRVRAGAGRCGPLGTTSPRRAQ